MKDSNMFHWNETIQQMNDENAMLDEFCGYCHGDEAIIDHSGINVFIDSEGNLDVICSDDDNSKVGTKVNFCPMCGRKF